MDIWREKNKKQRDYTFYSDRHLSWSRIDMLWATKELQLLTKKVEILTSSISDHNPIVWQLSDGTERRRRWILNEDLLDKQEIVEILRKEIHEYFNINTSPDINLSVIWDAFKAVIRGKLIQWNFREKKKRKEKEKQIQEEMSTVEK